MTSMREQRIAGELRRLRGSRTGEEVARAVGITPSKLSRIESGHVRPKPADVRALARFYGADENRVNLLVSQVEAARQPQWWTRFVGDGWDAALTYHLEVETEASDIDSWMIDLVPGPLQTTDTVRALVAGRPDVDQEQMDRRIALREARRARVERGELRMWVVLGEAVLYQEVGGPIVLADQLRYLTTLEALTVQVLPFLAGAHPGLGTSFHLIHSDTWPTTVYQDTLMRGLYQDEPEIVKAHEMTMAHVRATALSPRESRERLLSRANELDGRS